MSGASQVQAMPIVTATQDQPTHDNTNSAIMITSPDRNSQTECSLILPSTTNPPLITDDSVKLIGKKEDSTPSTVTTEDITATPQSEITGINLILLINRKFIGYNPCGIKIYFIIIYM